MADCVRGKGKKIMQVILRLDHSFQSNQYTGGETEQRSESRGATSTPQGFAVCLAAFQFALGLMLFGQFVALFSFFKTRILFYSLTHLNDFIIPKGRFAALCIPFVACGSHAPLRESSCNSGL